jgi:hypothetical protein
LQEEDSAGPKFKHRHSKHKFRRIENLIVLSMMGNNDLICGNSNDDDLQSSGFVVGCLYDNDKELTMKDYLPHFFNDVVDKGIILDSVQSCAEFVPSRESFISGINLPCSRVDSNSTIIEQQQQVEKLPFFASYSLYPPPFPLCWYIYSLYSHHINNSNISKTEAVSSLPKKLEKLGYDTLGIGEWHQSLDETSNVFQVGILSVCSVVVI